MQERPSQTTRLENHPPTYPQISCQPDLPSSVQTTSPQAILWGPGGNALLGRMPPLSQGLPRCRLKAGGWHSAGCEQPLPGYGHVAERSPRVGKLPLHVRPALKYLGWTGGTRRGLQNPIIMACPDLLSSVGDHACRKVNASHFLYNYHAPTAMDATDLRHQSCDSHLSPSEES